MNYSHLLMNEPPGAQRRRLLLIYSCCGLRTWQAIGAVFGLGGGIIAVVLGSLLSAVALITGDQSGGFGLHGVGAVFLFLTIPLLLCGGHCMDLLERSGKRQTSNLRVNRLTLQDCEFPIQTRPFKTRAGGKDKTPATGQGAAAISGTFASADSAAGKLIGTDLDEQ
jgi:hypothetical protein